MGGLYRGCRSGGGSDWRRAWQYDIRWGFFEGKGCMFQSGSISWGYKWCSGLFRGSCFEGGVTVLPLGVVVATPEPSLVKRKKKMVSVSCSTWGWSNLDGAFEEGVGIDDGLPRRPVVEVSDVLDEG